jgi:putative transposase
MEAIKKTEVLYDLLYRREADAPNALWQTDHTLLDIWILDARGNPVRPWLTVIMDDYSRAIAGYMVSLHAPSAMQTALTLRQAIWHKAEVQWCICGIPQMLYTDHGSDFTSQHIERVCAELKICLIFSAVGKPRGRGRIERFFATVNQQFLCTLPGYRLSDEAQARATLSLEALDMAFRTFILERYHTAVHSATGLPPMTRWQDRQFFPHLPESLEQLDALLLTVAKPRIVRQDGIHFQAMRYLDPVLAAYIGEQVIIRYDPRDMAEICVYHHHRFLCRAICQELAGETVSFKEIVQARRKRTRTLQDTISARRSLVDQWMIAPVSRQERPAQSPENTPRSTPRTRLKRYAND